MSKLNKMEMINAAMMACEKHGYPQSDEPLCLLVDDMITPYEDEMTKLEKALAVALAELETVMRMAQQRYQWARDSNEDNEGWMQVHKLAGEARKQITEIMGEQNAI